MENTSEDSFYLIAHNNSHYVPYKKRNLKSGAYGYELLPEGYGNNPSMAEYTEDVAHLIKRVVVDKWLVRAKVLNGPQQTKGNSVGLPGPEHPTRKRIRTYWISSKLQHLTIPASDI